jgi:thiamine pyrophosphate-dependent acetolactate synthase large subunit-like protein
MGTGRLADCYLRGDARVTLDVLNKELAAIGRPREVFQSPEIERTLAAVSSESIDYVEEPGRLDPRQAIRAIDAALPTDIPVVLGSGHQTDFGTMLFDRPRRIVSNYGMFGAIGQAPLITMGWLVGTGNHPTAVVEGDASFIMHLAEFETACRYGWPMLVVVMNDEGLGAEFHKSKVSGLQEDLSLIPSRDLGNVARALGGEGALATTIDELSQAVSAYAANPRPTVIDARISRKVLSTPYRRLWYAEEV